MSTLSQFIQDSRESAANHPQRAVVAKAIGSYTTKVADTKGHFIQWSLGREQTRQAKWTAINNLDQYLLEFEKNAMARGTVVHWAEDDRQARDIILSLCRSHQVRKVVKSKSMTTEEIHLNSFLEQNDITPVETDLGEYIVQIRGEHPFHIVTPVMHLSREDIDRTFHEKLGSPLGSSAEDLTAIARKKLRQDYLTAEMGITGANFVIADSGMISITENEGNARLSSSLPRIHVAICGIEKVIPSFSDLPLFLHMLAVSGTGQQLTCYNTLLGGPRQPDEADGPDEFHVILLDNGRTRLLADPEQREALHCIRCGACLNVCPVYKTIGGHAYGTTYQGPIGSVINAHLNGLANWNHLSHASSLCGACTESCPVHIDLHHHLLRNRRNATAKGHDPTSIRLGLRIWSCLMENPSLYQAAGKLLRVSRRILNKMGWEGSILDPLQAWTRTRTLPPAPPQSFQEWWKQRS